MLSLAPFRSKAAGLPDLLTYAVLVDAGIVQGKDGSLIAGFFYRGRDDASASEADRDYVTAMANAYLARFGSGWCMWVEAIRFSSPGYPAPEDNRFPDVISGLIDAERREMFERENTFYESEYVLILQYLPASKAERKLGKFLYDDDGETVDDRILPDFKNALDDFQSGLGDLLNMRRMGTIRAGVDGDEYDSDELVNYLHFAMYGEAVALRIPACPMYMDSWLGMESLWAGQIIKLGDKFISCVAIEGFPDMSRPGLLSMLDTLQVAYRWSSRFIFLDQHQAVHGIEKFRRFWNQTVKSFRAQVFRVEGVINIDSLKMTKEAELALGDVKSGVIGFGYYTSVVVLMSEDIELLKEQARYVKKEIEKRGFAARVEKENTQEAWLGSLPGHYRPNVRRPLIHTLNLADLLPLSAIWTGLPVNPCPLYPDNSPPLLRAVTDGATPINVNVHVEDVGHTLVFGPTGAGKSVLLGFIGAQALRYGASLTAFGKGRSLYALCSAIGGRHYDIGNSSGLVLCPLSELGTEEDVSWANEWVVTCYELQAGKKPNPEQRAAIHTAIEHLKGAGKDARSITNFVSRVQDKEVRSAMEHYTISGAMGIMLDGHEDSLNESSVTVFEMEEIMNRKDDNAIPVLLYLFRRFERSLSGQPAFLLLDEAWIMLGHPVLKEWVRKWLKEFRKKNCSVIIATQSLSDAVRSGILDVLIEQCPTKIFLPNKEADMYGTSDNPGPADLYSMFGLDKQQISFLKNLHYKKHYYYTSPLGNRVIDLCLGPLALSFVAVSDKETLREVKMYEAQYGKDWPLRWMDKRGIDYARLAKSV